MLKCFFGIKKKQNENTDTETKPEILNLPFDGFNIAGVLLGDNKLLYLYSFVFTIYFVSVYHVVATLLQIEHIVFPIT